MYLEEAFVRLLVLLKIHPLGAVIDHGLRSSAELTVAKEESLETE